MGRKNPHRWARGAVCSRPSTVGKSLHMARIPQIAEFLLADETRLGRNMLPYHRTRGLRMRAAPVPSPNQAGQCGGTESPPVPNGLTRRRRKLAWASAPYHVEVEDAIEHHTQPHLGKPRADWELTGIEEIVNFRPGPDMYRVLNLPSHSKPCGFSANPSIRSWSLRGRTTSCGR